MVVTNSKNLYEKMIDLRHVDEQKTHQVRYRYEMSDLEAALVRTQLARLPEFIQAREEIAKIYNQFLASSPFELPRTTSESSPIYYRYVVRTPQTTKIQQVLMDEGIEAKRPVFKPLHNYLEQTGYPATEEAFRTALSLPIYPTLPLSQATRIAKVALRAASAAHESL